MRGGDRWGGSKKCKHIPAPSRGAGLKSCPILAPSPLRGGENPHGAKRGGAGQARRGKIAIPNLECPRSARCGPTLSRGRSAADQTGPSAWFTCRTIFLLFLPLFIAFFFFFYYLFGKFAYVTEMWWLNSLFISRGWPVHSCWVLATRH